METFQDLLLEISVADMISLSCVASPIEQALSELRWSGSSLLPISTAIRWNWNGETLPVLFNCTFCWLIVILLKKLYYVCCACGNVFVWFVSSVQRPNFGYPSVCELHRMVMESWHCCDMKNGMLQRISIGTKYLFWDDKTIRFQIGILHMHRRQGKNFRPLLSS